MATVFSTGPLNPKRKKARGRIPKRKNPAPDNTVQVREEDANEGHRTSHTFPHLLIPTSLFVGSLSSNAVVRTLMGWGIIIIIIIQLVFGQIEGGGGGCMYPVWLGRVSNTHAHNRSRAQRGACIPARSATRVLTVISAGESTDIVLSRAESLSLLSTYIQHVCVHTYMYVCTGTAVRYRRGALSVRMVYVWVIKNLICETDIDGLSGARVVCMRLIVQSTCDSQAFTIHVD